MTAKKRESRETEWVVLEHVERDGGEVEALPAIEAWRVVGIHVSRSKAEALDALAGDQTGVFKAIAASAWRGGRAKVQETLVTSKPIDD